MPPRWRPCIGTGREPAMRIQTDYGDLNHATQDVSADPGPDRYVLGPNRNPNRTFHTAAKYRTSGQAEVFVLCSKGGKIR